MLYNRLYWIFHDLKFFKVYIHILKKIFKRKGKFLCKTKIIIAQALGGFLAQKKVSTMTQNTKENRYKLKIHWSITN